MNNEQTKCPPCGGTGWRISNWAHGLNYRCEKCKGTGLISETLAQLEADAVPPAAGSRASAREPQSPDRSASGEAQSGAFTEASERWREGLEAIVCPYCETEMQDSEDWGYPDMKWSEVGQCPHCEKEFGWSRDVNPRYSVCKLAGEASDASATKPGVEATRPARNAELADRGAETSTRKTQ